MLKEGTKAPSFELPDQNGTIHTLEEYRGRKVILYFYPKDNTSGCTLEAVSLRDNYRTFLDMGYQIIGVSKDSEASHRKFAEKQCLPFPLVADTDVRLCEKAGVWAVKKMAGREYLGILRTTFICDHDGTVTDKIDKVKTKAAAEQLFELLDGRNNPNPA